MATARAVPAPLALIPNALTIARLALIPVFVVLMVAAGHGHSWPAAIALRRRRDHRPGGRLPRAPLARRVARSGKIADPLADRLMIDAAVILLCAYGRLPWVGAGRDPRRVTCCSLAGYRLARAAWLRRRRQPGRQGRDVGALRRDLFCIVTKPGTEWPLWLFWAGVGLAAVALAVFYVLNGAAGGERHDESRGHGRRRGHAAAPADLEPAEADGADRRQAVHGAHRRAAQAARLRGRDRHRRLPAAGDPQLLRRRRELGLDDRATRSRSRRSAPPARSGSRADRLDEHVPRHLRRRALRRRPDRARSTRPPREARRPVTIGLKSVENPLEFGIVVTDEDGRVERFLEKPSWGQVFSDTINTGIYVLEPEVLKHIPNDRPYDFSKELFPLLLEMGRPLYGHVFDGYWQDIGNLDQFRQANFDALDEQRAPEHPRDPHARQRLAGGGRGPRRPRRRSRGPRYLGNYCRIARGAPVGPYSVLSASVTLRERAPRRALDRRHLDLHRPQRATSRAPIVGRELRPPRARARPRGRRDRRRGHVGAESVILPGVRIYPFKEVETGSQLHESLIWESRGTSRAVRQGRRLRDGQRRPDAGGGGAARRGARHRAEARRAGRRQPREAPAACRMIKRAMISGLSSTGRPRRRPARLPGGRRAPPLKSEALRRRLPRRRQPDRPGGDPDPVLRAARGSR